MLLDKKFELLKLLSELIDEAECLGKINDCMNIEGCKYLDEDNTCVIQKLIERI